MYIEEKYWGNYIGDTDDSLTLVEHLAEKGRREISVGEVLADFGLGGPIDRYKPTDFRRWSQPLVYTDPEGWETEIYFAVDLLTDLAALLLECRVSGGVDLGELFAGAKAAVPQVAITATAAEHELLERVLRDFAAEPLAYDLSELCPEEDMLEMAALCEELRRELYGERD